MTITLGAVATAVFTVADWPLPAFRAILVGAPRRRCVMVGDVPVRVGPELVAVIVYWVPTGRCRS